MGMPTLPTIVAEVMSARANRTDFAPGILVKGNVDPYALAERAKVSFAVAHKHLYLALSAVNKLKLPDHRVKKD